MTDDYRLQHRAPTSGVSLDDLETMYPDIYAHPEWYDDIDPLTVQKLRHVKGRPGESVMVYRALPPGVPQQINPGDWVTISESYARQHAIQNGDPEQDWPVIARQVTTGSLFNDGSSPLEYGWDGTE